MKGLDLHFRNSKKEKKRKLRKESSLRKKPNKS